MSGSHAIPQPAPVEEAPPFLELRVGGVHLTVRKVPYRLLALAAAAAGGGTAWIVR